MQLRDAGAQQILVRGARRRRAVVRPTRREHANPRGDEWHVRVVEEGELRGELAGEPLVIVVAEGHIVVRGGRDPGVARTGEAARAVIRQRADAMASGVQIGEGLHGRSVEDDDDLDGHVGGLGEDRGDRAAQQLRPIPGRDDDGYVRGHDDLSNCVSCGRTAAAGRKASMNPVGSAP